MAKTYTLIIAKKARDNLRNIDPRERQRILVALELLSLNPYATKSSKLSGTDSMRVRVGSYRIVYQVLESELLIQVINIRHRRDVYRSV